jgi:hypothetical protein
MLLFVGLGNPGAKHAGNRHNVGFMVVEAIAKRHGLPPWRRRFQGVATEGPIGGERVQLLLPGTYMNESGRAVAEAAVDLAFRRLGLFREPFFNISGRPAEIDFNQVTCPVIENQNGSSFFLLQIPLCPQGHLQNCSRGNFLTPGECGASDGW